MTRSLDHLTAVFLPSCAKSDDEMDMDIYEPNRFVVTVKQ